MSKEDIEFVLDGVKDELIDKLYETASEYRPIDYREAERRKGTLQNLSNQANQTTRNQ